MKPFLLLLLSLPVSIISAFHLKPRIVCEYRTLAAASSNHNDEFDEHPSQLLTGEEPDIERAKECAEHFGKCSAMELNELKKGENLFQKFHIGHGCTFFIGAPVHDNLVSQKIGYVPGSGLRLKRIQETALGHSVLDLGLGSITAPEDIFQELSLEQELSSQLELLQAETPPSYLFNDIGNHALGSASYNSEEEAVTKKLQAAGREQMIETLEEEGVVDSLVICAIIGMLMIAPQVFLQ